jgi:hypothetical protein
MPFSSLEFKAFAREWGFETVTSSPTFAQANGMAENGVKIAKTILKKAFHMQTDVYLLLLENRNTPVTGINYSPAQLLCSRQLRAKIPTEESVLRPKVFTEVREKLHQAQTKQKYYFDKNTKELPPLENEENILLRRNGIWELATVVGKYHTPRSYLVQRQDGSILRRNRKEFRKSTNQWGPDPLQFVQPELESNTKEPVVESTPLSDDISHQPGSDGEPVSTLSPNKTPDLPNMTPDYPRPRPKRITREPIKFKDYVK